MPERSIRAYARKLLTISVVAHVAAVVVAWLALVLFGEHTRPTFFLLYLPRMPFVAAAAVLLPLALFTRRHALALAELVALLIALFPLMGLRMGRSRTASGPSHRILTYNIFYANLGVDAVRRELLGAGADVIVLQASVHRFTRGLNEAFPGWTLHESGEFALLTKLKLKSVELGELVDENVGGAWAHYALETPEGAFHVVNVHPISARSGLFREEDPRIGTDARARQLASAIEASARITEPLIVAGDTNVPGLSKIARRNFSRLNDAFDDVGRGFGYTFPARLPWMRLDRVLGGPRIRFLDVRVLPRGASDHRAVVADFEIEPR